MLSQSSHGSKPASYNRSCLTSKQQPASSSGVGLPATRQTGRVLRSPGGQPARSTRPPNVAMPHSVDLLEEALQLARSLGFEVRREWLKEAVGGACRVGDRWILYCDLSLTADEQLRQVVEALQNSRLLPRQPPVSSALLRRLQA